MDKVKSGNVFKVASVAIFVVIAFALLKTHTIRIPVSQVQAILDDYIDKYNPLQGGFLEWTYDVTISDATVTIRDQEATIVEGRLIGAVAQRDLSTGVKVVGRPGYRARAFYFLPSEETELIDFTLNERVIPNKSFIDRGKEFFSGNAKDQESPSAGEVKGKIAINILKKGVEAAADFAEISPKELEVLAQDEIRKRVPTTLQKIFENRPLYSLDQMGAKGALLGAMIYSIQMQEGEIIIKFSLGTLILKIIIALVMICLILVLAFGMARAGIIMF